MKTAAYKNLLALACAAIAGCGGKLVYGEMQESTLVLSQPLGQTVPAAPPIPVTVPQSVATFTFQVPNIPLSGGSTTSTQAGFTVGSSMKLNQASLIMSASANTDFNGIDTLKMTITAGSKSQVLAQYTRDPARPTGKTLVLLPAESVELLDYLTGTTTKTINIDVSGSGTMPGSSWTADVDLDVRLKVNAGWP
jgi:hypothetical protein